MASPELDAALAQQIDTLREILAAGRALQQHLDDPARRTAAADRLESATERDETDTAVSGMFGFSASAGDAAAAEVPPEAAFTAFAVDVQAANVLIAAGQAAGELGDPADPGVLDQALARVQSLGAGFEDVLAQGTEGGGFAFQEASASGDAPAPVSSPEDFRARATETVDSLVREAGRVVSTVAETLSGIAEKVGAAELAKVLKDVGKQLSELPRLGRLIRKGLEKLERAIAALLRFVGSDVLDRARERAQQVWNDIKEGKHVDRALAWAFGTEETARHVEQVLAGGTPASTALERAGHELEELDRRFGEVMGVARLLAGAIGIGAGIALLTPLGPQGALAVGSLNLLLLGVVIVIGTDYTDESRVFRSVRGVRQIASSLATG
jgi:hypothetical protein